MRALFSIIVTLALASLILVGSSGTFVSFEASREVKVQVVPHENEYLGFDCEDGYAAVVEVSPHSETDFDALTVRNYLNELKDVWIRLDPDYSSLPGNVDMFIETEDGTERMIASEEEYTFSGHVSVSDVVPGEYVIPITMYARWDGGDAVIETCSIKLIVRGGPTIEKELISGDLEVPTHTYEQWTFRITVTSPDVARSLTIKDVIPGEFDIDSIVPSAGTYSIVQTGAAHHITWEVEVPADGSAYLDVTIHTKLNPAGKQEFTSCGEYPLNEGAEIVGYDIKSNGINVTAKCDNGNDCHFCMWRNVWGPAKIPPDTSADYHVVLGIVNGGDEKTLTIRQYVGEHFTVSGYSSTVGTVSVTPMPDGTTEVRWVVHLEHGETAVMHLWEHTDGIEAGRHHSSKALVISRALVDNCGYYGCDVYVKIGGCGCCSCRTSDVDLQALGDNDNRSFESDTGMEACEG
ncbi:hypothetical protein [Thermococcus barossii]|uniref:DUF11 domain-containing protein n=1 Tax=Thermococcus barossii TaxID=54077 RepID=A0A2Z2MPS5_9EURY|nr:hypothetical protein [Thermococcus barossii]ASJ03878.1 hypothetical protein A3L01_00260 [Thermococcus barossii]